MAAFAKTRYGKLHYREAGQGAPLVLLHATPRSSRAYSKLQPLLAPGHHVIAPDTLGFGLSDPLPKGASIEQLATSVADLLTSLGIEQAAVFGLHTGNKIAAALAAAEPTRISKLMLCGMSHSIILDPQRRETAIKTILRENPIAPNDVGDESERQDRAQGQASVEAIYAANYQFDLAATLPRIPIPTMVVELATPAEAHLGLQAASWRHHLADCSIATLHRSDRDVLERFPDELADIILRFLAQNRAT